MAFRPFIVALFALFICLATPPPLALAATNYAANWAEARQKQLPAYRARAQAAQARAESIDDYLNGKLSFEGAFPELADAPLGSPAFLSGQLTELDADILSRESERRAPLPKVGTSARLAELTKTRDKALDAEDAADTLERRILLGLLAHLRLHPELQDQALTPLYTSLDERAASADSAFKTADPSTPEVREAAAQARGRIEAERRRIDDIRRALRDLSLVAGAPHPDPSIELADLEIPSTAPAALDRIQLLMPFLGPEEKERTEAAALEYLRGEPLTAAQERLSQALATPTAPPTPGTSEEGDINAIIEALQGEISVAEARVAAAQRAQAELRGDLDREPILKLKAAILALDLEAATTTQAALLKQLETAQSRVTAEQEARREELDEAKAKAEATEKVAQEAAQEAAAHSDNVQAALMATLLTDLHAAQKAAEELWAKGQETETTYQTRLDEQRTKLDALSVSAATAQQMGPLDPRRVPELDRIFRELREVIDILRSISKELGSLTQDRILAPTFGTQYAFLQGCDAIDHATDHLQPATSGTQNLPEDLTPEQSVIVSQQQDAIAEQLRARAHTTQALLAIRDAALGTLATSKELRRQITPDISSRAQAQERSYLLSDIKQEARFTLPNLLSLTRSRIRAFLSLPSQLTDPAWVWNVLKGSLQLFGLIAVWFWLRGRSMTITTWLLDAATNARKGPFGRVLSFESLRDPTYQVVRALIDLLAGAFLVTPVGEAFPEVGLLIIFYLQFAVFRLLMGAFDLLVGRYAEMRPSLISLGDEAFTRFRRTIRVLFIWVIARQATLYVTVRILGATAISQVLESLFSLALLGLTFIFLHQWEPTFRRQMRRHNSTGKLGQRLKAPPASPIARAPRAFVMIFFLLGQGLSDLLQGRVDPQSSMGRIIVALNRYRMGQAQPDHEEQRPPPEKEVIDAIVADTCKPSCYVARSTADEALTKAIKGWQKEQRRGLVALVGDRGTGKRTYLDNLEAVMGGDPYPIMRGSLPNRLLKEERILQWLAEVAQLKVERPTQQTLREALDALEPHIFILENLHLAFLRRVGGFEALSSLLYVLNGASKQHFFILSFHGQAFSYLSRLGSLINTQVFRAVIHLQPFGETAIQELVESRLREAGYRPDYRWLAPSHLRRAAVDGEDQQDIGVEEDRLVSIFYGVLADASMGNPQTALSLWSRCLIAGVDEGTVGVRMGDILNEEGPSGLGDPELFALAALRMQDRLAEAELSEVINMSPGMVRALVRDLDSRGLTFMDENLHIAINQGQLPAISRLLRRRHFIQG